MTEPPPNLWLVAAGTLSVAAALLHLACIAGGSDWYRFLGAGEGMARMAARGDAYPAVLTIGIACVLLVWAAYAFAGAGLLPRLPLMRTALVAISAIYLLRGAALFFPAALRRPDLSEGFLRWSSAIVLVFGIVYAIGTWRAWNNLNGEA